MIGEYDYNQLAAQSQAPQGEINSLRADLTQALVRAEQAEAASDGQQKALDLKRRNIGTLLKNVGILQTENKELKTREKKLWKCLVLIATSSIRVIAAVLSLIDNQDLEALCEALEVE